MKNRLAIVLLILALGPLVLLVAWFYLGERLRTAELTLAAISQPREEVVVSGFVKNVGSEPFSLETLLIEEPGKEPYRRVVSLDANWAFELTLGKPGPGNYRFAVRTRKSQWGKGVQEDWLRTPILALGDGSPPRPAIVKVRDYDYPRLFLWSGCGLAAWAVLLLVCVIPWGSRQPS